jgi:hypothetical protein
VTLPGVALEDACVRAGAAASTLALRPDLAAAERGRGSSNFGIDRG